MKLDQGGGINSVTAPPSLHDTPPRSTKEMKELRNHRILYGVYLTFSSIASTLCFMLIEKGMLFWWFLFIPFSALIPCFIWLLAKPDCYYENAVRKEQEFEARIACRSPALYIILCVVFLASILHSVYNWIF